MQNLLIETGECTFTKKLQGNNAISKFIYDCIVILIEKKNGDAL